MGGKNCAIVDSDADLDQVVPDLIASAFAYAGQKCSAASRVLAHEAIAEELLERLGGRHRGAPGRPGRGLRHRRAAADRARCPAPRRGLRAGDRGDRTAGRAGRARCPGEGWYCPPRLVTDVEPAAPVLREEVFGPLVTLERVAGVAEAFEVVESLPVRAHRRPLLAQPGDVVAEAAARLPVGNLYVNRPITGARVGQQPFGGNRRSGVGSKAGGPDYLLQFTEPRVLTENVMRHGIPMD